MKIQPTTLSKDSTFRVCIQFCKIMWEGGAQWLHVYSLCSGREAQSLNVLIAFVL